MFRGPHRLGSEDPPALTPQQLDWFNTGLRVLLAYLEKWAAFTTWLETHDRSDES